MLAIAEITGYPLPTVNLLGRREIDSQTFLAVLAGLLEGMGFPQDEAARSVSAARPHLQGRRATRQPGVRLLEQAHILFDVVAALFQRLRLPFAALDRKEVAVVDMDRAGHL